MISSADLDDLRAGLAAWDHSGLPRSLATDCARLLDVTDTTISFIGTSDQVTLCASSDNAQSLDEWEFTLQEGPSIDAAATTTTRGSDTAPTESNPWPRLTAKAHAIGYQSIAAVPIRAQGTVFATLNLHDRERITPETLADAQHIADELASLVVGSLSEHPPPTDQTGHHDEFHQATGMVMNQMGIDAGAAAGVLRAHAGSHDRLLTDIAARVVARTLKFQPLLPN